ncbi:MAG: hypothetical protein KDB18_09140 [Salinibacterium sp.]|nr:hypothetical protein [Salinibacterium sp.]
MQESTTHDINHVRERQRQRVRGRYRVAGYAYYSSQQQDEDGQPSPAVRHAIIVDDRDQVIMKVPYDPQLPDTINRPETPAVIADLLSMCFDPIEVAA